MGVRGQGHIEKSWKDSLVLGSSSGVVPFPERGNVEKISSFWAR